MLFTLYYCIMILKIKNSLTVAEAIGKLSKEEQKQAIAFVSDELEVGKGSISIERACDYIMNCI